MISFQAGFGIFFVTVYALAMASTALAVLLGCAVEDPKLAQEMLPILFVPQMLFAGFFVTPELIPEWLRWARYLCTLTVCSCAVHLYSESFSPISVSFVHSPFSHTTFYFSIATLRKQYAVRILLVAEFEDCADGPPNDRATENCRNLLINVEANPDETWWYWLVLVLLFLVFRVLALIVLRKKATKFF